MVDVNGMLEGESPDLSRRKFTTLAGSTGLAALAGCSRPSDSGKNDTDVEAEEGSMNNSSIEQEENLEQSQQELPTQEPQSKAEEQLERLVESQEDLYSLKFDNLEYVSESPPESGLDTYEMALNDALEKARQGDEPYTIWAGFDGSGEIFFFPNLEDKNRLSTEDEFLGTSEEFDHDSTGDPDSELVESEYSEFIGEYLDGEKVINHAGEVPDYAKEAL